MKKASPFLLAFVVLSTAALAAQPPNMIGTWTGSADYVTISDGYLSLTLSITITDQTGPLFRGALTATISGVPKTIPFTGYISTKKDVILTLGIDPDNSEASMVTFTAKLTGPRMSGYWQNIRDSAMGYFVVRR